MSQNLIAEQEEELREILQLAKVAEDKLRKMSDLATQIVEKHESWYKQAHNQTKS